MKEPGVLSANNVSILRFMHTVNQQRNRRLERIGHPVACVINAPEYPGDEGPRYGARNVARP
jgi:hypothetical protein